MAHLADLREVEVELVDLGRILGKFTRLRLHVLCLLDRKSAERNLTEERELLPGGRYVGHDDFTLVWSVDYELVGDGF